MFIFISHDVILQICDAVKFMYRKVQDFFKVASKPFATQEATANATVPQQQQDLPDSLPKNTADKMLVQFVALSIKVQATIKFVHHETNKLTIWDRVGNLNSLCKVIGGQSICLAINYMKIKQFFLLSNAMDLNYTTNSPWKKNTSLCKSIPSFLASFAVWYQGFIKYDQVHHLLLSHDQCMRISVDQLQQADMKPQRQFIISKSGERANYETGLIIAGQAGTNCQHAQSNNQSKYSRSTFADQLTFVKQPAFANQSTLANHQAFANLSTLSNHQAFDNQTTFANQSTFDNKSTFANQSAFDNQPTFANQSTINNRRHSISQNAFRPVSLASLAFWYQFFYNPQVISIEIF